MNAPTLLVMVGVPRSGKSTVASYLARTWGFTHVSSDEVRARYGIAHFSGDRREQFVQLATHLRSLEYLMMGENVVIDTTGMFASQRLLLLDLRMFVPATGRVMAVPAKRVVVAVETSPETLKKRYLASGRDLAQMDNYMRRFEPVEEIPGVTLLRCRNDTPAELELIKEKLVERLGLGDGVR